MKHLALKINLILIFAALVSIVPTSALAQNGHFENWPAGSSPRELGKRLAENWVKRDFEFQSGKRQFLIYPEVCTWYGALATAKLLKDKDLQSRLCDEIRPLSYCRRRQEHFAGGTCRLSRYRYRSARDLYADEDKKYLDFGGDSPTASGKRPPTTALRPRPDTGSTICI